MVDAETGEGVAKAQVHYKPEDGRKLGVNNEFFPATTGRRWHVRGHRRRRQRLLLVDAPGKGFYRLAVRRRASSTIAKSIYPHGLLEVDVPAEGTSEPVEIALQQRSAIDRRAAGSRRQPAHRRDGPPVQKRLMKAFFNGETCRDGKFVLEAAEPGRKYRVFLSSEVPRLAATVEVEAPADGKPIDVTLQPWATIRGRYVYDGGDPAPEITNFTRFRIYPDREPTGNAAS